MSAREVNHARRYLAGVISSLPGVTLCQVYVASYIKVGDKFVAIEAFQRPVADDFYIEGALELSINGTVISSIKYWDLIDQLWAYLIQGIEKLRAGERFETYWPDQPIKLVITPLAMGMVRVERSGTSDPDVKVVIDKYELIDALLAGASEFFDVFGPFSTAWDTSDIVATIGELKQWRSNAASVRHND